MEVKKTVGVSDFLPTERVKVKRCGNVTSVSSSPGLRSATCLRLSKEQYLVVSSGEVLPYNHNTSRASDLQSVSQSLAFGRDMLNTNIVDVAFCRWVTLTYAANMTDPKKLHDDFDNFNRKCRKAFGHYEYIVAAEPQGRGAWHLHCVFIFPGKAPYMPNEQVAKLWGKGFVQVKRLDDVDNVGAYLTAYLGDYELQESEKAHVSSERIKIVEYDENGVKKSKRYIKGGRLKMYPPGFHIFRFSRGLKKPDVETMTYRRFEEKEKASSGKLTFCKRVDIVDDSFETSINYEYYNKLKA